MGMKELQQQALNEIVDQGKLTKQQADWLLSQHLKNQKALEGLYDEEISRQRQVLEEKLARRKALAQAAVSCLISIYFATYIRCWRGGGISST